MCLSVVAKVDEILENGEAIIVLGDVRKTVQLGLLTGEVKIGEWVLIHTGFAIAKVDEDRAREIREAYQKIGEAI